MQDVVLTVISYGITVMDTKISLGTGINNVFPKKVVMVYIRIYYLYA
jgi:hypothetical protein